MISIDYKDRRPICEQLVDKIGDLAARGFLPGGSQLPSVRSLAMELSINPNTIQKAYTELERKGVIVSVKGRGSFVTEDTTLLKDTRVGLIIAGLSDLVKQSISLGYPVEEFIKETERLFSEGKEREQHD